MNTLVLLFSSHPSSQYQPSSTSSEHLRLYNLSIAYSFSKVRTIEIEIVMDVSLAQPPIAMIDLHKVLSYPPILSIAELCSELNVLCH
ncbi:hypothetical protein QVD17_38094 [Tagetes erecta]|uniref:Uncharacterized protein n=1 Tax=Tagetes erecta TaxID=13708 RepID=A0AAD8NJ44_TARER|nr:hypothetical protein QVD17_38094 [Tagetes erecta]